MDEPAAGHGSDHDEKHCNSFHAGASKFVAHEKQARTESEPTFPVIEMILSQFFDFGVGLGGRVDDSAGVGY